ncbi:type VI secretion protein VasK, partial [Pseudomonas putida]|nr:type VI secretion protein VasK [Pseudomonas putida]
MQFKRARLLIVVLSLALLVLVLVGVTLWLYPSVLNFALGSVQGWDLPVVLPGIALLIVLVAVGGFVLARRFGASSYRHLREGGAQPVAEVRTTALHAIYGAAADSLPLSRMYLRQEYGWFWSRRIQVLVVVGEPAQVNAIVPGLIERQWLSGRAVVLIYGGSLLSEPDITLLDKWQREFRWRGIDGVVWALSKRQVDEAPSMSASLHHLQGLSRYLGRQLPVHVWQICESQWGQSGRGVEAVGCLLTTPRAAVQWKEHLGALQRSLREQGLAQMQSCMAHDFLLRLARDLQSEGAARWYRLIERFPGKSTRGIQVRGVWFSLPVHSSGSVPAIDHHWPEDPAWSGILSDRSARPRRLGWSPVRIVYASALGLAAVWAIGLLASFTSNRVEVSRVEAAYRALQQPAAGSDSSLALAELVRELSRLSYRGEHGAPWYQRFGLNRSDDLREAVWPLYVEANERLLR